MTKPLFNSSHMSCHSAQIYLSRAMGEENGTVHIITHSSVFVCGCAHLWAPAHKRNIFLSSNASYDTDYLSFTSLACLHHSEVQWQPQRTVHNVQFCISTKCKEINSKYILRQTCVSSQSKQMGSSLSALTEGSSFNSLFFSLGSNFLLWVTLSLLNKLSLLLDSSCHLQCLSLLFWK